MGKAILAVIVGYVVMTIVIILCFTGLQFGLGTERVFDPGTYNASMLFNILALGVSLAAALIGGIVAGAICGRSGPPQVLAGIIFVLGLIMAVANLNTPDPGPRTGDITPMEAASKARQPNWYSFTIPIIGAAGVIMGSSLIARKK
ncbi:MAG: hypothetical protein KF805_14610 [Phycisphaeraceae bacterium]|nr:hypothetical protein [Phycisphaeraceae bacterium]